MVLPTDTVYGIAAALDVPAAVAQLFRLKGRPGQVPVAVLVADETQARELVRFTSRAGELVRAHWPGALTVVLDASEELADRIGSAEGTMGVRCPDHDLVRDIARRVGPLATTSANRHGEDTPETAAGVAEVFPDVLVVDGGRCAGAPSTVVDARGSEVRILRAGRLRI